MQKKPWKPNRIPPYARSRRGDILLEYVLLLGCLIPVLLGFQAFFFNPSGGANLGSGIFNPAGDYKGDFGLLGQWCQSNYNHVATSIAQPVP